MPKSITAGSFCAAALALGLSALPAYAGFEWVAPSTDQYAPPPVANNSVYVAPQPSAEAYAAPDIISPVIITGAPHAAPEYAGDTVISSAPAAPAVSAPVPIIAPASASPPPVVPLPRAAKPDLATETISMAPSPGGDIVQGFASRVPLPLALRQLLPAGYTFTLDQDVDASTQVSFRDGKPWRETLSDMLAPAGLVYHQQDHAIAIGRAAAPIPAPAAASLSPLPAPVDVRTGYLAPPPTQPAADLMQGDWSAERGETLRKVLTDWCRRSNTELQWVAEYDYPIEASARFSGSFEDAVRNLLAGFDGARPQPVGELHNSAAAGQTVLVVETRGNNYSN